MADDATLLPDSGDAGKPENHEDAGDIDGESDAVVLGAEDFDGEVNEEGGNKISGKTESV